MTKTTKAYDEAVLSMCQEFADLMYIGDDEQFEVTADDFVGREVGDVFVIGDMYISVGDIKQAIEAGMNYEEFSEWYWGNVDDPDATQINLRSWIMGFRRENNGQ